MQTSSQPNANELLVNFTINDNVEKQRSSSTLHEIITMASSANAKYFMQVNVAKGH
jgi:hypothetical protein